MEVDRVIDAAELFPILHPKKSMQVQNSCYKRLIQVMNFLINFRHEEKCYGIQFLYLTRLTQDLPEFQIKLDFSIVLNRVYLEHYKESQLFWQDLLKVIDLYEQINQHNQSNDQAVLCRRMKALIAIAYRQWHSLMEKDYKEMQEFKQ